MDDVSNLSAAAAKDLLDGMTARYQAGVVADRAAVAAEADRREAAITERVSKVKTSDEASAAIEAKLADGDFVRRWLAGDAAAVGEMEVLHRAKGERPSSAEKLLAGTAPDGAFQVGIPVRDQLAVIEDFRDEGLSDPEIEHVFRKTAVSQAEYTAARRARDQLLATPDWVLALNAGHPAAKRDLHRLSIILSSPIHEGAS
jgi:hypothetical protein